MKALVPEGGSLQNLGVVGGAEPLRIFINYRREDSSGHAGRLYDDLARRFGEEAVFMDVDQIAPGVDFAEVIEEAVASTHVFLAVIGTRWLTVEDAKGRRRLDKPEDFVRIEIEAALRLKEVRLIPVQVGNAEMPSSDELPEALAPLAGKNAVSIRDTSWHADADRLIRAIEKIEGQVTTTPQANPAPPAKQVETVRRADHGAPHAPQVASSTASRSASFGDPIELATRRGAGAPVKLVPLAADEQLVWSGRASGFRVPGRFVLPPTEERVHSFMASVRVTNKRLLLDQLGWSGRKLAVSIPWSEIKNVEWADRSYREWLVKRREVGVVRLGLSGPLEESRGMGFGEEADAEIRTGSLQNAVKMQNQIKAQLS